MKYNNYAELTDFLQDQEFSDSMLLEADRIRISSMFVITSVVMTIISIFLYMALGKIAAVVPVGLFVLIVIFVSPRIGVVLVFALQVWDIVLNPEKGGGYEWVSPGRVLTILCVLSYWVRFFSRSHSIEESRLALFFFACFVLWALCSVLWSSYKIVALWGFTKIFIQFSFVYIAVDLLSGRKVIEQVLLFMIIGGCTAALYALVGGVAVTSGSDKRLVLEGAGTNALGISIGIAILAAVALTLLRSKSILMLTIAFGAMVGMGVTSLKTGTRSVIIGVPLAISFGLLLGYWRKLGKLFSMGILIFVFLGGVMYWALNTGFVSGALRDRIVGIFGGEIYGENIRWQLWADSFELYLRNPMGVGIGNETPAFLASDISYEKESHNTLLSVLIELNIIGLILFTAALVTILIKVIRVRDPGLRCTAAMIFTFCMINAMKGSIHTVRLFWLPIALTMTIIETDFRSRFDDFYKVSPEPVDNQFGHFTEG